MKGWISTFFEQGMEEPAWFIFQDERFTQGDQWSRDGMHRLGDGDHLTIFKPDGQILYCDVLRHRKVGFFRKIYAGNHDWSPPEIALETWQAWFNSHPPLRAELIQSPVSSAG